MLTVRDVAQQCVFLLLAGRPEGTQSESRKIKEGTHSAISKVLLGSNFIAIVSVQIMEELGKIFLLTVWTALS